MKKCIMILTALMLLLTSCSTATLDGAGKEVEDTIANVADADNKYVQMVKGGYRSDAPELTYEDAFSAFFGTPRWKYFEGEDGEDVVEFTGDCTYQDVPVKARIQFVVDEENGTFEAAYLALNEVPQDALTLAAVITKAFEEAKANEAGNGTEGISKETGAIEAENGPESASEQVLICGIPLRDAMEMSRSEAAAAFGEPDIESNESLEYGPVDPEWLTIYLDSDGNVDSIGASPEKFTYNGQSLAQDDETLAALLGDGYCNMGGAGDGFQCQWDWENYSFVFSFSSYGDEEGNFIPHNIFVYKNDDGAEIDEDYSWVEGDIDYSSVIDPSLVGRWRSYSGKTLTLDDSCNLEISWKAWDRISDAPDRITWTAENGRLKIRADFVDYMTYSINTTEYGLEQLSLGNPGKDDQQVMYYRNDTGTNALAGEWTSYATLSGDMILYEDGTGCRSNINFSWYADETTYTEVHTQGRDYDYTVSGDTLTLFFSEGAEIFTRVGS